jgi:hypothetical protein
MMAQRRIRQRKFRRGSLGQDERKDAAEGNLNTAPHRSADNGPQMCRFEWADETSPTFVLRWICTREQGHQGQHIADTGEWAPTTATHSNTARHSDHQHRSPPHPKRQGTRPTVSQGNSPRLFLIRTGAGTYALATPP